jgi:Ras-related protein Rab-11A
MTEDEYDVIFKIVLIGDSGVGKTNILSRYLKNEFRLDSKATIGVEFGSKRFVLKGYNIKAQIWDTAGQERYKSITNAYYKGAKGALLVYDVGRKNTFDNIDKWITDLKQNSDPNVTIVLIGNKCDVVERQVSTQDGEDKARLYGSNVLMLDIAFLETSALKAINIDKAFQNLVEGKYF